MQAHRSGSTNQEPGIIFHDKKQPRLEWREAIKALSAMQRVGRDASVSQDFATIELDAEHGRPAIMFLADTHVGDWATDYDLFERITDEILETPNLYIGLLGDLASMAIKLRGVAEVVTGNLATPELQVAILSDWLNTIAHKVAFATWDNHAVEREEIGSGISAFKALQGRHVVYHGGIGHPDIIVGTQRYRFAVSHRFPRSSQTNPCYGAVQYLLNDGHDREIAAMGDRHVPGIMKFYHGTVPKVAANAGSIQTSSGYARRHFSLFTSTDMPVVALDPEDHVATPYMTVGEWKRATQ